MLLVTFRCTDKASGLFRCRRNFWEFRHFGRPLPMQGSTTQKFGHTFLEWASNP